MAIPLRVLLVEDDSDLRRIICEALELSGHAVTTARDGREALATLEEASFDALCCDVAMPGGVSGIDVARRVQATRPATRIVLTSGYPRHAIGTLPPGVIFLAKPYRLPQLLAALGELVHDRSVKPPA